MPLLRKPVCFMTILLADGNYPVHPVPLHLLHSGAPVVCCDGAANRFVAEGGVPLAIVGDGDSLSAEARSRFADCLHIVEEQETNDLAKAVNYIRERGETDIVILGATGKRECHTLGNIAWLMEYHRRGLRVVMLTDHCEMRPMSHTQTFDVQTGQQVSIINFGARRLRSEGLRYPLYDFDAWWQGTLNEALSTEVTIHAEGDYLVILDYPDASSDGGHTFSTESF